MLLQDALGKSSHKQVIWFLKQWTYALKRLENAETHYYVRAYVVRAHWRKRPAKTESLRTLRRMRRRA